MLWSSKPPSLGPDPSDPNFCCTRVGQTLNVHHGSSHKGEGTSKLNGLGLLNIPRHTNYQQLVLHPRAPRLAPSIPSEKVFGVGLDGLNTF